MTKRVNAKKKISRSLGVNLWGRANDTFLKRNYKPGQHGTAPKRDTNHSIHLKAKQKVRKYYDIKESQFRTLFDKAKRLKGNTEDVFAGLLESRLASVVYRANFAPTVFSARQLVSHGHILLNGKKCTIPSIVVPLESVITVKEKSKKIIKFDGQFTPVGFVELDKNTLIGKYLRYPERAELNPDINETYVVE